MSQLWYNVGMIWLLIFFIPVTVVVGIGLWHALEGNISEKTPLPELLERQKKIKEAGKRRIMNFLGGEGRISNNEVEDLLKVSDATATRYLEELEQEGLIRQVGRHGRSVHYVKM